MTRLQTAGMITYWEEPSENQDDPAKIEWSPEDDQKLTGDAAFLGLATLLDRLTSGGPPLSPEEQAMIQIIRAVYWDNDGRK